MSGVFDKIIGCQREKDELMRICDVLKRHDEYEKLGISIPRGLMLAGAPGVGKTLMAKCLIEESGCKCIELRKDSAKKNFVNKISNAFKEAKEASKKDDGIVIVFMDDLDKFAESNENGGEEFSVVQSGIESVKDSRVFVLATVNDKDILPESLRRKGRFDEIIYINKPQHKDSKQLFMHWLSSKSFDLDDKSVDMLTKFLCECTRSEIESFVNKAGTYAVYEGRALISFDDLARAYTRVCLDFDARFAPDLPNVQIERIAYHEAGHAVLGLISRSREVTIVCMGNGMDSEGLTSYFSNGDLPTVKAQIEGIICSFGGKAAEQVVYGDASVGCGQDLWKIGYKLSKNVVELATNGLEDYIPFAVEGKTAPMLYDRISTDIAKIMQEYYDVACDLLAKNRPLLDAIASALLKKNYLTMPEIYSIFDDYKKNYMPVYLQV